MGKSQRTKGFGYERDVARRLRHIFPDAERLLEYQWSQANGIDLQNTGKFDIQCKRHKKYVPINTIFEIKGKGIPVLVTKADRLPDMAVLPLDALIDLIEKAEHGTTVQLQTEEYSI